jgi:hypothetical protein
MTNFITNSIAALCVAALTTMATPVAAESFKLHEHKAWSVWFNTGHQDGDNCSIETVNRTNDTLDVTVWEDGAVQLYIFMAGYDTSRGTTFVDLILDVDYARWTLNDTELNGGMFLFDFDANERGNPKFFDDLRYGSAVALKAPNGSASIATWSLAGSRLALAQLSKCMDNLGTW